MILMLVIVALVLAITMYHALFGLFSGLINVMCSIIAVAVALGFYEPVAAIAGGYLPLAYAEGASVLLLFMLTIGLLRGLADTKIRGNVTFPHSVDWGGGVICGFINAQLAVGILLISFFMLPLGASRIGFERFNRIEPDQGGYAEFTMRSASFLRPDEFTVGLFNFLSSGSLNGGRSLKTVYPNFIEWVSATGNTPQVQSSPTLTEAKTKAYKSGIRLDSYWMQNDPVTAYYLEQDPTPENRQRDYKEPKQYRAPDGLQLMGCRLLLTPDAADQITAKSKQHTFRPTMIRLVGKVGDKSVQYFPRILAGADAANYGQPRIVNYDDTYGPESSPSLTIDAYFEVAPDFKPWFIEYRRRARARVSSELLVQATPESLPALETRELRQKLREVRNQGFVGTLNRRMTRSSTQLPYSLPRSALDGNSESRATQLLYGRASGYVDELRRSGTDIRDFAIDREQRVVQVRYSPRAMQSLPGKVFDYANQLASYLAVDDKGNKYRLTGYYAIIKRKGKEYMELFYAGQNNPVAMSYNASLRFQDVQRSELTSAPAEAEVGMVFIVPKGVRIVRVETSAGRGVDLGSASVDSGN